MYIRLKKNDILTQALIRAFVKLVILRLILNFQFLLEMILDRLRHLGIIKQTLDLLDNLLPFLRKRFGAIL